MIYRRTFLLGTAALSASTLTKSVAISAPMPLVENSITLTDASGSGARDYPVRIARPFVRGEIVDAPQAIVAGTPVPTQADVKTRWPDGSVQHAILSFVVRQIPGRGRVTVKFANQKADRPEPLTERQMLDEGFDFEAVMQIVRDGGTETASAREMLSNRHFTVWCSGPIATTIVLADHSEARKYDFGFEPARPIRPIFHATFWPDLRKVHVRVIGENACTDTLQDVQYSLVLTGGVKAPTVAFRQEAVTHYAGTRWTRSFWIGSGPNPKIDIDHNLAYLVNTFAFPNFDSSLRIPEDVIVETYRRWVGRARDLYGDGGWQQYMPTTGGRDDIGPYTAPQARWLLSGDYRLFEIVSGQADLAGAWPLHAREGNPVRRFDADGKVPAIGRPISVYGRPTLWLFDDRDKSKPEDRVAVRGARILGGDPKRPSRAGGWVADGAHQPDPYSALYTLTGDYFALEQLQLWAAAGAVGYNPAYKAPTGPSGAIIDQVRGNAWVIRNRVHAAFLSPDGSPEKAYFRSMVDDAVAFWEGMHDIRGTRFENSRLWTFARQSRPYLSPLHLFFDQKVLGNEGLKTDVVSADAEMWQHYMLMFELGVAREKGFPTGPLLSWMGVMLTSQFMDARSYNFYNIQRYFTGVRAKNGDFFRTWTETLPAYANLLQETVGTDVCDGYASYAYGASTMLLNEPQGAKAYAWLRDMVYEPRRAGYARCPKWAFKPRI